MTAVRPSGDWDGAAFAHEGFVFGSDAELLDRVLPFVSEGYERDEPVLVVAGDRVRSLLADALGADLARLHTFAAAESWWQGGHGTLAAYDHDLRALRSAVPSWRLVAEPVWLALEDGGGWSRFEAVANDCYASMPYYSLCLHDRHRLTGPVLDAVARSHPLTWGGAAPARGDAFVDPRAFLRSVQPVWHRRPSDAAVASVTSHAAARRALSDWLAGLRADRADDAVLAVHELVANALRASPAAELAGWRDGDRLVVEVSDWGTGLPDETLGYVPPGGDRSGGRGMWLAWSLADDAAVATGPDGTAIRLFFRERDQASPAA